LQSWNEVSTFSCTKTLVTVLLEAGHLWLMSVILVTWEAEIWRIEVPGQPEQIVLETPSPK
jgi:hypothetical protein